MSASLRPPPSQAPPAPAPAPPSPSTTSSAALSSSSLSSSASSERVAPTPAATPLNPVSYRAHGFYYPWYGDEKHNGAYLHWEHEVLGDWMKPPRRSQRPTPPVGSRYQAPNDAGSSFWPKLGLYSSIDPEVMHDHMRQLIRARIGVLSVSWYPPGQNDGQIAGQTSYSNEVLRLLFDIADQHGLKINLHMEPYDGRSAASLSSDIRYAIDTYGDHPAFYRTEDGRPLFYAYDSYQVAPAEWAQILHPSKSSSKHSIRQDARYNAVVLGLLLDDSTKDHILQSGFDGFYTYFAATGFTRGATPSSWPTLMHWAGNNKLQVSLSVGPGYDDEAIRPWNFGNTKGRRHGDYYSSMLNAAVLAKPQFLSITSFNEWHEGTQIEEAVPHAGSYPYLDYQPNSPSFYLDLTAEWLAKWDRP